MPVDPSIFKMYDIRGVYPEQIDENIAYKIARAYSEILKKENREKELKVVVGSDMRTSSPSLKKKVIDGLLDSGLNVVDVGLVSTPSYYFAVSYYDYDGGIQVSASHLPTEFNGFKLVRARAVPVSGMFGINEIKEMVLKDDIPEVIEKGNLETKSNITEEEARVQRGGTGWEKIKPFKIVVDTGNGMGALDIEALFKDLPCSLTKLNFDLDGTFPVHIPDPLKEENLKWVKDEIVNSGADLGIATDGDADRWFFIDEKGETVPQPILRGLMAQIELQKTPGATICYDIRPGKMTKEMIEEAGGKAVMTRVGHSLIKEKMLEVGAVFGAESSGHYFYKFPYGTFEAPMVLVLKFLAYLSEQDRPLSEMIKPYKKYFHSGEINSKVKDKNRKIEEIAEKYRDGQINYLDGITVEYPNFWFNVRPSNTEDILRLNLEAIDQKTMEEKRDEVLEFIRS